MQLLFEASLFGILILRFKDFFNHRFGLTAELYYLLNRRVLSLAYDALRSSLSIGKTIAARSKRLASVHSIFIVLS